MAGYSASWYSTELKAYDFANQTMEAANDTEIYVWADFSRVKAARLRTLVLLTTLLKEKYTPTMFRHSKIPEHVFDDSIRECFKRIVEISPPDQVFADSNSQALLREAVRIVETIDPAKPTGEDSTLWIDEVLDSIAEYAEV